MTDQSSKNLFPGVSLFRNKAMTSRAATNVSKPGMSAEQPAPSPATPAAWTPNLSTGGKDSNTTTRESDFQKKMAAKPAVLEEFERVVPGMTNTAGNADGKPSIHMNTPFSDREKVANATKTPRPLAPPFNTPESQVPPTDSMRQVASFNHGTQPSSFSAEAVSGDQGRTHPANTAFHNTGRGNFDTTKTPTFAQPFELPAPPSVNALADTTAPGAQPPQGVAPAPANITPSQATTPPQGDVLENGLTPATAPPFKSSAPPALAGATNTDGTTATVAVQPPTVTPAVAERIMRSEHVSTAPTPFNGTLSQVDMSLVSPEANDTPSPEHEEEPAATSEAATDAFNEKDFDEVHQSLMNLQLQFKDGSCAYEDTILEAKSALCFAFADMLAMEVCSKDQMEKIDAEVDQAESLVHHPVAM